MLRPLPRLLLMSAGLASAVVPGACSADTVADAPTADATTIATPTPTDPTTSTAAPPTPEHQVEAAYLAIMARYFEHLANPDPDNPQLKQDHEGHSLALASDVLHGYVEQGLRSSPGESGRWPTAQVLSIEVEGDSAGLRACHIDDSVVRSVETNQVINDSVVSKLTEARLQLRSGEWVLQRHRTIAEWADAEGCRV